MKIGVVKIVLLCNMICSILLGAFIYYIASPDVLFVSFVNRLLDIQPNAAGIKMGGVFFSTVRNFVPDFLWGYALVFALSFFIDNNAAGLKKILITALVFSAVMESLQLTVFVGGTFDVLDIAVEFLAEVIAVFIIKNIISGGGTKSEKEI